MQTPCSPLKKPLCGCLTPAQGNRIIESLAWKKSSRISESHRDNRRQSTAAKPAGGAAWALLSGEDGVGKGGPGREAAPAPGTALPGVLAALEQPPNNFPAPPQTFPSAGEAPPSPPALRPSIPREPQRSRGGEGKSEAREGGRSGLSDPPQGSFPAARSRSTPRARSVPGTPGGGTRCPGRRARERGWREGGKGGCRPYLSALVNLRKAWRRSWKER